jgi:endonuclease YncB( thermonuclease family)
MQYILFYLVSLILYSPALKYTLEGKIIKVADGDTITIIDNSDNKYRIRLGGIDPPEKDQP